jgi:putative ABC transport system substrate-binding protein
MRRREFIALISGGAIVWPVAVRAQQSVQMRLIGVLMGYAESHPLAQSEVAELRNGLAKLGWTEGQNLHLELRWSAGNSNRIRTLAKELVGLRPDVILSQTTQVTSALARETRTIPIVFVTVGDPVASGFVANLARPGGNITGFILETPEQGGKWVQLLKEIAPNTVRVALLSNPATGASLEFYIPSIQAAASSSDVQVSVAPVGTKDEIEGVIAAQARNPGGGLIVMPAAFNVTNRDVIIAMAAHYGMPAIYFNNFFPKSGGLISYSPDFAEQFRQAPEYIDRILKGVKPGQLTIQSPTKFDLVINLKTAKAPGLQVPALLQQVADEVIE